MSIRDPKESSVFSVQNAPHTDDDTDDTFSPITPHARTTLLVVSYKSEVLRSCSKPSLQFFFLACNIRTQWRNGNQVIYI